MTRPVFRLRTRYAIECLAFAGFDEFVFDDRVRIAVEHDLQTALEFIGAVGCHDGLRRKSVGMHCRPLLLSASARVYSNSK